MLCSILKKTVNRIAHRMAAQVVRQLDPPPIQDEQVAQVALMNSYRLLAAQGGKIPSFHEAGFRRYSQFEEDGILLLIFSLITPKTRTCVEICAGDGRECCTANLIINHGWWGHLFDGDSENVRKGIEFFGNHRETYLYPPKFTQAWITAENVNQLLADSGVSGPVDLLSLDMDGMDYWIWDAIDIIHPTVVLCEVHNPIPPDLALTVPYQSDFAFENENFRSASLAAMVKLGKKKGYRLVGAHRYGFNAFFIKNGVGEEYFPQVDAATCQQDPFSKKARAERWPEAKKFGWLEV